MKLTRVLLIQDSSNDETRLFQLALAKKDIRCHLISYELAAEALDFLFATGKHKKRWLHDLPDIIFLDIDIGTINGYEAIFEIRKNLDTKTIPVIVLVTHMDQIDQIRKLGLDINGYVLLDVDINKYAEDLQFWIVNNQDN